MPVNMQVTVFTLVRLKIVPTIKNLICRCLLYNLRYDAVDKYIFLDIHNWCKWLDCDMEK